MALAGGAVLVQQRRHAKWAAVHEELVQVAGPTQN